MVPKSLLPMFLAFVAVQLQTSPHLEVEGWVLSYVLSLAGCRDHWHDTHWAPNETCCQEAHDTEAICTRMLTVCTNQTRTLACSPQFALQWSLAVLQTHGLYIQVLALARLSVKLTTTLTSTTPTTRHTLVGSRPFFASCRSAWLRNSPTSRSSHKATRTRCNSYTSNRLWCR